MTPEETKNGHGHTTHFRESLAPAIWLAGPKGNYISTVLPFGGKPLQHFSQMHTDRDSDISQPTLLRPHWMNGSAYQSFPLDGDNTNMIYFQPRPAPFPFTRVTLDSTTPAASGFSILPHDTLPKGMQNGEAAMWLLIANSQLRSDDKKVTFVLPKNAYPAFHEVMAKAEKKDGAAYCYSFMPKPVQFCPPEIDFDRDAEQMLSSSYRAQNGSKRSDIIISPSPSRCFSTTVTITMERAAFNDAFGPHLAERVQALSALTDRPR